MAVAQITSKGQVTIPKRVRDSLGLHTGDKLEFTVESTGQLTIRPITTRIDEVFGVLHNPQREPVSVEEMHRAIGGRMRSRLP